MAETITCIIGVSIGNIFAVAWSILLLIYFVAIAIIGVVEATYIVAKTISSIIVWVNIKTVTLIYISSKRVLAIAEASIIWVINRSVVAEALCAIVEGVNFVAVAIGRVIKRVNSSAFTVFAFSSKRIFFKAITQLVLWIIGWCLIAEALSALVMRVYSKTVAVIASSFKRIFSVTETELILWVISWLIIAITLGSWVVWVNIKAVTVLAFCLKRILI